MNKSELTVRTGLLPVVMHCHVTVWQAFAVVTFVTFVVAPVAAQEAQAVREILHDAIDSPHIEGLFRNDRLNLNLELDAELSKSGALPCKPARELVALRMPD